MLLFVLTLKKQKGSQMWAKFEKSILFISTIFISSANIRSEAQKVLVKRAPPLCSKILGLKT